MNVTLFPVWRMTPEAFDAMEMAEIERWRAGLPLLHRDLLTDHYACDPEEIFKATDAVNNRGTAQTGTP